MTAIITPETISYEYAGAMRTEQDVLNAEVLAARQAIGSMAVTQQTEFGTETYYEAADPGYKSSFTRDSVIAASLAGDPDMLLTVIDYSANRIGTRFSPITGEEPGKPHHELPSVENNGRSTAYNACDTAAELLRGIAAIAETQDPAIVERYRPVINSAVGYIRRHVDLRGLFTENPLFARPLADDGVSHDYALKVTYWKDSELNRHGDRHPHYPIVYSLAHFQNAYALERIGAALGEERLARYGRYMVEAGLRHLWRGDHFVTAIDEDGEIDSPNSDSLHCLLYIPTGQLPKHFAEKVEDYMRQLETAAGYRAGIPVTQEVDPYHMGVWSHEQALLNAAARKYGLRWAEAVTRRIINHIKPSQGYFPEVLDAETFESRGNNRQLWTMAAYVYFADPEEVLL